MKNKKPHNLKDFFNLPCQFIIGAHKYSQIADSDLPEIAFIGRSNVGKSSLINSLLSQKIAITSKTPGRTKQLNFFSLANKLNIVDMPGFGYAKVGKKQVEYWQKTSYQYFANRQNLKRVFLLIDARRGVGEKDLEIMHIFNALAVSYQLVLTKIDQLKTKELENIIIQSQEKSQKFASQHPNILVTSAEKGLGMLELKKAIAEIF